MKNVNTISMFIIVLSVMEKVFVNIKKEKQNVVNVEGKDIVFMTR